MFFRCGVGAGKNGYEIFITTSDSRLYGEVITVSKNGSVIGSTSFDQSGEATYTVEETGTYTVSVTIDGSTYSETVEVAPYEVELTAGFTYERWLGLTDLDPDDYSSLAEVLADEEAVRQLMTIHAAVDYLASFTADDTSVVTILNNDLCAKWITLRDYAEDSLTAAYEALMSSIGKYGYGEWALMGQVPVMTSDNVPYGEAFASYEYSTTNKAYNAFNGVKKSTRGWYGSSGAANQYVGYEFTEPKTVCKIKLNLASYAYNKTSIDFVFEGADSKTGTWTTITDTITATGITTSAAYAYTEYVYDITPSTYKAFRIRFIDVCSISGNSLVQVDELQFYAYAPKGNVPIMTSNTAPYGEASASSTLSGRDAYRAFNGDSATDWASTATTGTQRLYYKFATPTNVKQAKIQILESGVSVRLQYTDDGSTWQYASAAVSPTAYVDTNITADADHGYHMLWGVEYSRTDSGNHNYNTNTLQFYGRQMTVSVPIMTSNTAPYGEASANAEYSTDTAAWKAFMNDPAISKSWSPTVVSGTTPNTGWIKYDFGSKVRLGFVLIFTRSADSWTGSIEGYDGENWETIHTISTPQTGNNYPSISTSHIYAAPVTTAKAYTAFRFTSTSFRVGGTGSGYSEPNVNMVQFFGFSYSEKEWDTEHPRHYIYDHGVELEEIEKASPANGWTVTASYTYKDVCEKMSNRLHIGQLTTGDAKLLATGFGVKNAVDFNGYSHMFINFDPQIWNGTMVAYSWVSPSKQNVTSNPAAYIQLTQSNFFLAGLDVVNVSDSKYISYINNGSQGSGYTNPAVSDIYEWWLE